MALSGERLTSTFRGPDDDTAFEGIDVLRPIPFSFPGPYPLTSYYFMRHREGSTVSGGNYTLMHQPAIQWKAEFSQNPCPLGMPPKFRWTPEVACHWETSKTTKVRRVYKPGNPTIPRGDFTLTNLVFQEPLNVSDPLWNLRMALVIHRKKPPLLLPLLPFGSHG